MSSNRNADKSIEEVRVILKSYFDNYHKQFEADADPVALKLKLNELATKKKDELFARTFSDLTPKTLRDMCEVIAKENLGFKPIEESQPVQKPKKIKGK